jgi:hypothetical protein
MHAERFTPTPMPSQEEPPTSLGASRLLAIANLAVPFLLYAVIAVRTSVNIPYQDDFDSIGWFVEHYASLHGFWAKLGWILTAQHVQYKLIFLQTISVLQFSVTGHTNYRVLQLLGDLSMPAIVALLWLILRRGGRPLTERLWLFAIPCYVVLAIRYSETVNWAMSGLQNMAVIPLAVATIYFVSASSRRSFLASAVFLVVTICASGNGFFVAAVLLYLLLTDRRIRDAAVIAAISVAMAALYAVHYHVFMVYAPVSASDALKSALTFPFAFLGNAATSLHKAVLLGLCLTICFVILAARGWRRVCPASFGAALFCLITAAGVTATRYRSGAQGALAGHYVMYSVLLIALEYIAAVRLFLPTPLSLRSRGGVVLAAATAASFLFCLWADAYGYRNLHARQRDLIAHLILWERHPDRLVLVPDEDIAVRQPSWIPLRISFQDGLQREIAAGLYILPYTAADPLPIRPHSPSTVGIEDERP